VQYQGGIKVGADVVRASVILLVGRGGPLCGIKLLLQVAGSDLLLLPCVYDVMFARASFVEGLACGSHNGKEGLLSLLCGSLGRGGSIVLSLHSGDSDLPLRSEDGGGEGARADHGQGGGGG
jgi:hypothetical protein